MVESEATRAQCRCSRHRHRHRRASLPGPPSGARHTLGPTDTDTKDVCRCSALAWIYM